MYRFAGQIPTLDVFPLYNIFGDATDINSLERKDFSLSQKSIARNGGQLFDSKFLFQANADLEFKESPSHAYWREILAFPDTGALQKSFLPPPISPVLNFVANKNETDYNGSIRVSWSALNFEYCEGRGDWHGPKNGSGSETI